MDLPPIFITSVSLFVECQTNFFGMRFQIHLAPALIPSVAFIVYSIVTNTIEHDCGWQGGKVHAAEVLVLGGDNGESAKVMRMKIPAARSPNNKAPKSGEVHVCVCAYGECLHLVHVFKYCGYEYVSASE